MNYIKETIEYLSKLFQWWIIVEPWEKAVRTRFGKNMVVLEPGTHFRLPFFDIIYIQTVRLRIVNMPPQTITTRDNKTITAVCAVGYSISDMGKLYNNLSNPEGTICNVVQGEISDFVYNHDLSECGPLKIEQVVLEKLKNTDYGVNFEYVKMVGYAVVKTYRLIQDGHWQPDGLYLSNKS